MPTALPETSIRAAGGVLVRGSSIDTEYLLTHRPRYDDWSLPKGKLSSEETFKRGALREIEEETGLVTEPITKLGSIAYETPNGNGKVVRYWMLDPTGGSFEPNAEVDDIVWLPYLKARRRMTYSRDREVLEWANRLHAVPNASRMYLVRHADAGRSSDWEGDDALRPLSPFGRRQRAELQDMLTRNPVTQVYSSPFTRCVETVQPIADSLQLRVRETDDLGEGRSPEGLRDLLGSLEGHSIVVCSHGELISKFVGMVAAEGARLVGPMHWTKGSVWVVDAVGGKVNRARYLPAPA